MGSYSTGLQDKWLAQSIVSISAKIADATEMVQKSKEMAASSEAVLLKAQTELKELFMALTQENREKFAALEHQKDSAPGA